MARAKKNVDCPRDPVALSAPAAAAFLGVSENTLRDAVDRGLLPRPRQLLGRVLWDADELHAAFRRLPQHGDKVENVFSGGPDWSNPSA